MLSIKTSDGTANVIIAECGAVLRGKSQVDATTEMVNAVSTFTTCRDDPGFGARKLYYALKAAEELGNGNAYARILESLTAKVAQMSAEDIRSTMGDENDLTADDHLKIDHAFGL